MSVGERLKEERQRLGMSQPAFAALADASKGAQAKWEKNEASPNALALIAFAEAGADVLYILSGKRQDEPFNQRAEADTQATIDRLEETLHNPAVQQYEQRLTYSEVREGARQALERIATSTSPDVSEPARSRADDIIRAYFPNDKGAAKRRSARFASLMLHQQNAGRELEDVLVGLDVNVPRDVHHHLLQLALDYQIAARDLVPVLGYIGRLLSQIKDLQQPYGDKVAR